MRSLHRCTRMACPRRLGARVGGARFAVGWPKMAMRGVRSLARLRLRKLQMAQMAPAMLGVPPPPRAPRRRLACQGGDCERHPPSACKPERAQDASTAHAKEEIASAISMLAPFSHSCRGRCTQSVDRFNHRRSGRTGRCARRACEMGTQLNTPGRHWVSSPSRRTWEAKPPNSQQENERIAPLIGRERGSSEARLVASRTTPFGLRLVAAERVAQILPKGKSTRTRCTTSTGRQSSLRSQTSCSSHDPTPRQKLLEKTRAESEAKQQSASALRAVVTRSRTSSPGSRPRWRS